MDELTSLILMSAAMMGFLFYMFFFFLKRSIVALKMFQIQMQAKATYNELNKKRDEMIKNGDLHEWIDLPIAGKMVKVCKKTGWVPEWKDYIVPHVLRQMLSDLDRDKRYKTYRNEKVADLAKAHDMTNEAMEELVEKIFDIKKQFHLREVDVVVKEMKEKASGQEKDL